MYACTYACPHCRCQQQNWSGECEECGWIDNEPDVITEVDTYISENVYDEIYNEQQYNT